MSTCLLMHRTDRYMPRVKTDKMTAFGQVLEELLEERGWNQETLSLATDPHVSQGMISNYKWGKRSPKRETIETLARALASGETDFERQNIKYSSIFNTMFRAVHSLDDIEYDSDPDFEVVREAYDGGDEADKKYLIETAKRLRRAQEAQDAARAGAIGRRVNDD